MWVNKLLPHTCLRYSFVGLLIYPWFSVWMSRMFLLEQLLVVWWLAILRCNRVLKFNIMNKNMLGGCEQCKSKEIKLT
jgi:hypothetical protein